MNSIRITGLEALDSGNPVALSLSDLACWHVGGMDGRLLLPAIQRSAVWSNEQIINFWDSLLRGYPIGSLLVYRVGDRPECSHLQSTDANGAAAEAGCGDYQLFDGQQRMAALLLGMGQGQFANSRCLWVDVGAAADSVKDLRFSLRISSDGQPFGYRPEAPNRKLELGKRRDALNAWLDRPDNKEGSSDSQQTRVPDFRRITGSDLAGSSVPGPVVELAQVWSWLAGNAPEPEAGRHPASDESWQQFIASFRDALRSRMTVQMVPKSVLDSNEEYLRYFRRVGQGGTALSNDELTYSIIKFRFPEVRQRMQEMMKYLGRLAGEVDIVLASLRVARAQPGATQGAFGRPKPDAVSQLDDDQQAIRSRFVDLLGLSGDASSRLRAPRLQQILMQVREALELEPTHNPTGLPSLLLARMPRELVDVLLLLGAQRGDCVPWKGADRDDLIAFAIHWLLFVSDNDAAAFIAFRHASQPGWTFTRATIRTMIAEWEVEGRARCLPKPGQLKTFRDLINLRSERLRSWDERFALLDEGRDVGLALRVFSTHAESIRRALLWLQRNQVHGMGYDPTSDRDEDLPIDLDHIIPHARFNFDWRHRNLRLCGSLAASEEFRHRRSDIGNSLGNFRWMGSSENRRRRGNSNPYTVIAAVMRTGTHCLSTGWSGPRPMRRRFNTSSTAAAWISIRRYWKKVVLRASVSVTSPPQR